MELQQAVGQGAETRLRLVQCQDAEVPALEDPSNHAGRVLIVASTAQEQDRSLTESLKDCGGLTHVPVFGRVRVGPGTGEHKHERPYSVLAPQRVEPRGRGEWVGGAA